jgi:hypothetical protein
MHRRIKNHFDLLKFKKIHGHRENVTLLWRDKDRKVLVDKDGMILVSEGWRNV